MDENILERILEGSMKPTNLPLETLRKITDDFSTDRIIGEGGFGTVYKGVIGKWNVAVKRIRSSMTVDQKLYRREVDSLMEVNHQNVVQFLGLCSHTVETPIKIPESRGYIYAEIRERLLCFEYISNGSLDTKIADELRGLEWDKRYQIIKGLCAGLHYLHTEKHILHMDLKPANILLDNEMVPKIMDFGLSRPTEYSRTMTGNHFSSPGYTAPENLFGRGRMSVKSDMYSLGVIIIELITGHKDIPDDKNNILRRWRHRWSKSLKETPPEYQDQVTKCIEIGSVCQKIDPYARPSISEIMSEFVEMDNMHNHSRNASESKIYQLNPHYSENDMLGVEPLELHFIYNKKQQIQSCSVELSNDTEGFFAFRIQTMSPLPYSIEPNNDIMTPRSKCNVDITLPAANIYDRMAAPHYGTSNKQYNEEFIVRSIKVNEGITHKDINQDMFDKYTVDHNVDEIHLEVAFEEPCCEEVIGFSSKQANHEYKSSGTGGVHLTIRSNEITSLKESNKRVMLEITGSDYTSDRLGLDLVAILDVSGSMQGEMMQELRTSMRFIVRKLGPIDRLSIVTFSDAAKKLCPLRQMTEASKLELEELSDGLMAHVGSSNIMDGLLAGLKVLTGRKVSSGRVAAIMLMSGGRQGQGDATSVTMGDVPVYTFGLGHSSDHMVLSTVAANSRGGTFSHIGLDLCSQTMAISQCLAGLLTVAVQDLELTVEAVGGESMIVEVTAGSCTQRHDTHSVTVAFGNLYSREVRNIIVDLVLPAIDSERSAGILKVTYSYNSSSRRQQFVAPPEMLTVLRTDNLKEEKKPPELQMEEVRLRTAKMIKEARTMADFEKMAQARDKLVEAQTMLVTEEQSNPLLRTELQELLKLMCFDGWYNWYGCHYALSSESSHGQQRYAARGRDMEVMRLFATPRMDMYLEQAKKFHKDPKMLLPSVDDDIKEEVGVTTIDVESREEEMRRLSLEMED